MSRNNVKDVAEPQVRLLDELQNLLERQIELAHKGHIAEAELLARQTDGLVSRIVQAGLLERQVNRNRRELLQRLYEDLRLTLATQKADIAEKLTQVRKGKKTIQTYRSNI